MPQSADPPEHRSHSPQLVRLSSADPAPSIQIAAQNPANCRSAPALPPASADIRRIWFASAFRIAPSRCRLPRRFPRPFPRLCRSRSPCRGRSSPRCRPLSCSFPRLRHPCPLRCLHCLGRLRSFPYSCYPGRRRRSRRRQHLSRRPLRARSAPLRLPRNRMPSRKREEMCALSVSPCCPPISTTNCRAVDKNGRCCLRFGL